MADLTLTPSRSFRGSLEVPGDKSISHRALLFSALAQGQSRIQGLSAGDDLRSTRRCLEALGVRIEDDTPGEAVVHGLGKNGLQAPRGSLDCGNSGTTFRLLMGLLSGQPFECTLVGDASLSRRPMARVATPLSRMGARIHLSEGDRAPARISPASMGLRGTRHSLQIQSAQVKSALLLAGLYAEGETWIEGDQGTRDHTERLLPLYGVRLLREDSAVGISGQSELKACDLRVPGDPSSAAFWIAGALISDAGEIKVSNVLLNPTRIGFLKALERAGARIQMEIESEMPEPVGTLRVRGGQSLRAIEITESEIPSLVDELPILAVILAARAEGVSFIRGASELRVKESDRLASIARNLVRMGARVRELPDGLEIEGATPLQGARIETQGDHRIAMAFSIAALFARGETMIDDPECVSVSYPGFYETFRRVTQASYPGGPLR